MKKINIIGLFLFISLCISAQYTTYYISMSSRGNGSGSNWSNSADWSTLYANILPNIAQGDQIWFEAGNYPQFIINGSQTGGNATWSGIRFEMYGGFAGEANPRFRNLEINKSYFDGLGIFYGQNCLIDGVVLETQNYQAINLVANFSDFYNVIVRYNSLTGYNSRNIIFENGNTTINKKPIQMINCLFAENYSENCLIWNIATDLELINCTFTNNDIYVYTIETTMTGSLKVRNSIIWDYNEVANMGDFYYSAISNWAGAMNDIEGNIYDDPSLDWDYHLYPGSPAMDAGNNSYVPRGILYDLDSKTRIYANRTVDMGCYEVQE